MPLPVVNDARCLVVDATGQVIVQLRDCAPGVSAPGTISFFGGRMSHGETPSAGAVRELKEEIGITVNPADLDYLGYVEHWNEAKRHLVRGTYFVVPLTSQTSILSTEGTALSMSIAELVQDPRSGQVTREMAFRYLLRQQGTAPAGPLGSLDDASRIAAIGVCLSYASYEANVYWQRNALYLALNAVLAGALVASPFHINSPVTIVVASVGALLNWPWIRVNRYSKFLAEQWREDARRIAVGSTNVRSALPALLGAPAIPRPPGRKPSNVMNDLAMTVRWGWAAAAVAGLVAQIATHSSDITDLIGRVL